MKNSVMLNLLVVLTVLVSLSSCGKKKENPSSQHNPIAMEKTAEKPAEKPFVWPSFKDSPDLISVTVNQDHDVEEKYSKRKRKYLRFSGPFTMNCNNLEMDLVVMALVGPKGSSIVADNLKISAKDISKFEGTLKCSNKCLLRTATPADKFKLTLIGKFVIEFVEDTAPNNP